MPKITLKRVWHFLWEDDSVWSWLLNLVLAFVVIKFIVYPGLGWVLGTSHPIVAVVSGSMEHDGNFDGWWVSNALCGNRFCTQGEFYSRYDISKENFRNFIFHEGFNTGDIIVLFGTKPEKIRVGDVIVFRSKRAYPIIHRVIDIEETTKGRVFTTKGDHNPAPGIDDLNITEDLLIGKAAFRIPYLGWIKIGFVRIIDSVLHL
ncbi:MAG: signal peptidase I [Candidatus Woesearchaeota archaeon]